LVVLTFAFTGVEVAVGVVAGVDAEGVTGP
jgi:hypothetical protein